MVFDIPLNAGGDRRVSALLGSVQSNTNVNMGQSQEEFHQRFVAEEGGESKAVPAIILMLIVVNVVPVDEGLHCLYILQTALNQQSCVAGAGLSFGVSTLGHEIHDSGSKITVFDCKDKGVIQDHSGNLLKEQR